MLQRQDRGKVWQGDRSRGRLGWAQFRIVRGLVRGESPSVGGELGEGQVSLGWFGLRLVWGVRLGPGGPGGRLGTSPAGPGSGWAGSFANAFRVKNK